MTAAPALLLLSGGLDSVTAWANQQGHDLSVAHSFNYGQQQIREITTAAAIAAHDTDGAAVPLRRDRAICDATQQTPRPAILPEFTIMRLLDTLCSVRVIDPTPHALSLAWSCHVAYDEVSR